jgi:diguanylate cyclase (GGDEF)-like protein
VISLKRLLATDANDATSYSRLAWLILEAVACHAVESDPVERQTFQNSLRDLGIKIEKANNAGMLVLTGEAIKSIETYNRSVQHALGSQIKELQSIVSLFTRSMLQVSKGSAASATKLRQIERQIEKTSQAEDLRTIKVQLQQSLEVLCEEAVRQEQCTAQVTEQLRDAMSRPETAAVLSEAVADLDMVTGLPNFRSAEQAIRAACAAKTNTYAVLLCVERLEVINSRFGFAVGDRILMIFGQHLAQSLSKTDQLFRWRGPGFLALMERNAPEMAIRAEIARVLSTRMEQEIELNGRSVLLPIGSSWTLANTAKSSLEEISQKLDKFAAAQAGATGS